RRGGVAAGRGDRAGGLDGGPGAGQLGQAVRPAARVADVGSVEAMPGFLVTEPEVGRQVDDLCVGPLLSERGCLPVREGHAEQYGSGQRDVAGGLEAARVDGWVAGEVRVDFRDRLAGAACPGDRADLEVGV